MEDLVKSIAMLKFGRDYCSRNRAPISSGDELDMVVEKVKTLGSLRVLPALSTAIGKRLERDNKPTLGTLDVGAVIEKLSTVSRTGSYWFSVDDISILFVYWVKGQPLLTSSGEPINVLALALRWGSIEQVKRGKEICAWLGAVSPKPAAGKVLAAKADARSRNGPSEAETWIITAVCHSPSDTFKDRLHEIMKGVHPKPLARSEDWEWISHIAELAGVVDVRARIDHYLRLSLIY